MSKAAATAASPLALFQRCIRTFTLNHGFQREILLVAAIGAVAYYATALGSFSPFDPSWFAVAVPQTAPQNLAGAVGANVSALVFFTSGLVAWLLPLPLLTSAWLIFRGHAKPLAYSRLAGWLLFLTGGCAVLALRWPSFGWRGFDLPSGGVVGTEVASYLVKWFGPVGGWIALATTGLSTLLLIGRRSLLHPSGSKLKNIFLRASSEEISAPPDHASFAHKDADKPASPGWPLVAQLVAPLKSAAASAVDNDQQDADKDYGEISLDPIFTAPPSPIIATLVGEARTSESATTPEYSRPPLSVFQKSDPQVASAVNQRDLEATAAFLVSTFADFGVHGKIVGFQPGPVVTVFEFQPEAGVKQSKVIGLIDDLALALKVDSIFIHPVRGKRALGVQVPNAKRESVHLGDILSTASFTDALSPLTFGMGKTINGQPMCADLSAMPHLPMAGATGSGKSVGINAMLCSIIMKAAPSDVRMILVDPKMLELSIYEGIPHLLMPVITEPTKASLALQWAAAEMERRYKIMQHAAVRNLAGFNDFWVRATDARKQQLMEATGEEKLDKLPYILLVIDELADLMMTAPKDVESSIQRLAQKARASGIHMVLATQRPSVDIITGVIKANLPCRIAFQVVSKHDSRTILDLIGAEKLLGKGDMLLQRPGIGRLERLQGALITDEEVLNLVASVKATSPVRYDDAIISWIDDEFARRREDKGGSSDSDMSGDDDPKWDDAINIARTQGAISASFLQRQLKIGYNRAARIVEHMESRGYVDKADGAKPRRWLGASA